MSKLTAIYVRRSVSDKDKDNNSLSIDSQKADCIKSLTEGERYQIYCDDGCSGKNISQRPAFQEMMNDARNGLISRIIVKKYDRFSRNMRDYLNVTAELDSYGVGVTSLTEPFNTSTKEGRMMRNTLLGFAEFERETIAARVSDAYSTRSTETGFYQGGKVYYGYEPERRTINGKTGSVLVPSDKANVVKLMYQLYVNPSTSLDKTLNYFRENKIDISVEKKNNTAKHEFNKSSRTNMWRSHLSGILKSPLYVRANAEVYQYLTSKGYEIIDDIKAFDGIHGLFRHKRNDGSEYIKVGYHEGLIDSETWLAVQDKKSHNQKIPNTGASKHSWLVGLTKCGCCGYSLSILSHWNVDYTKNWRSYRDRGMYTGNGCVQSTFNVKPDEVEEIVFKAMRGRLNNLTIAKTKKSKPDTEVENIKAEIIRVDDEIHKLMDKLANSDVTLFEYIQDRIKTLHLKKSDLNEKIRVKMRKHKEIDVAPLTEPMSRWDELSTEDKHAVAVAMIDVVYISDEHGIDIRFCI